MAGVGRTFRAPGKLVVLGEYAVLDGAPAVVAAVDRGVQCVAAPSADLRWTTPGDDRFVRAALAGAPPAHYRFAAWNPTRTASKAGLGSSAAATVAAVLARRALAGEPVDPGSLFADGLRIHRAVQGSGSGIDVAASAWGGVLRYHGERAAPLAPVRPIAVWSGRSARTGPRVQQYLGWGDRSAFVAASTSVVQQFAADPVRALRTARRLLEDMAATCGIEYRTPDLDAICDLAEACGGGAKPSGAGGGDVAVALFPTPADEDAFRDQCALFGYAVIEAALAPGATEESP